MVAIRKEDQNILKITQPPHNIKVITYLFMKNLHHSNASIHRKLLKNRLINECARKTLAITLEVSFLSR